MLVLSVYDQNNSADHCQLIKFTVQFVYNMFKDIDE